MSDAGSPPRYPALLVLEGRPAVVVGGGPDAEREAAELARCGAVVRIVAPELTPALAAAAEAGDLAWEPRGYVRGDLTGAFVAVCAAGSDEVCRAVVAEAEERGCLVTVPGALDIGDFRRGEPC